VTVEGVATAQAVAALAQQRGMEVPVTSMVAALAAGQISLSGAVHALLSRPLKKE